MTTPATFFAPYLYMPSGVMDISFYRDAFGAVELRRLNNNDGSLHVAELSIDNCLFHIHEEKAAAEQFSPASAKVTTALIGLFVADVDAVVAKAANAGAIIIAAPKSYDYGYRQAQVKDPFGHVWLIEAKLSDL